MRPGLYSLFSQRLESYPYGFNGKENDNETVSTGEGTQDYGMRIYNPALGKFLSVDPLTKKYPELTTYQFASNSPIWGIDLDGMEIKINTTNPINYRKTMIAIMSLYTIPYFQSFIDLFNSAECPTTIWIDPDDKNQYDPNTNRTTLNENDITGEGVAHEFSHRFYDHLDDKEDRGRDKADFEKNAVNDENGYRSRMGLEIRTKYNVNMLDIFEHNDLYFSSDPKKYNPNGEKIKITSYIVTFDASKLGSDLNGDNFDIKSYNSNAPEVLDAFKNKNGAVMFYDYQKDKNSKVEKRAIVVTLK